MGDGDQLEAIGPGGGFQGIRETVRGRSAVEHITRQKEGTPEQKIVKQFALGQAREALSKRSGKRPTPCFFEPAQCDTEAYF